MEKEERKRLKNRRIYVSLRLREIKGEQAALKTELEQLGKTLAAAAKSSSDDDDSDL